MLITSQRLKTLFTGFQAAFNEGFTGAPSQFEKIAMKTVSGTTEEKYGWIGRFPSIREWVGDRIVDGLSTHDFTIVNRDFESTIGVQRNDIEDDRIGMYAPIFRHFGSTVKEHPDHLVFELLARGFEEKCYDGQFFFDTDHPVHDKDGAIQSVSNIQAGAGEPWYLIDTTKSFRPLIFQNRREFKLVAMDKPDDENVFHRKEFIYGVDGRCNVGFGLWQLAYASKAELTPDNYELARAAMTGLRGDGGRRLGVNASLLVVPTNLEGAGRRVLKAANRADGSSNEWVDSAELLVSPWL